MRERSSAQWNRGRAIRVRSGAILERRESFSHHGPFPRLRGLARPTLLQSPGQCRSSRPSEKFFSQVARAPTRSYFIPTSHLKAFRQEQFARQRDALREADGRQDGTHVFAILFFSLRLPARLPTAWVRDSFCAWRGGDGDKLSSFGKPSPAPATTRTVGSSSPSALSPIGSRSSNRRCNACSIKPGHRTRLCWPFRPFRFVNKRPMSSRQLWLRFRSCRLCAVTATGVRPQNSSPPSSVNSPPTGQERSSWWWTTIGFIRATRSRRIFIITSNCRMPRFAFAVLRCRAASIGATLN